MTGDENGSQDNKCSATGCDQASGCKQASGCNKPGSCQAVASQTAGQNSVLRRRFRPNSLWQCGYLTSGMACSEGPSPTGKCCQLLKTRDQSVADCTENCSCVDQCNLASVKAHPELPSHLDLGPCVPRRSPWFSRQNIAINLAILTGGLLLLSMTLPGREQVYVPGGLSTKHSQILGNKLVKDRCSLCHANPHGKFVGTGQDLLCMNCHRSHMPDADLRSPHDLTRTSLVSLRSDPKATRGLDQTHCASCHREHHGASQDLKLISNARCQACHEKQFDSLANGHPEFVAYPYRTPRSITFDHNSHASKHFAKDGKEFQCNQCHHPESNTSAVGISRGVDYETGCASCHDQALQSGLQEGWAILSLPSIEPGDVSTTELADWPVNAQFGYEGVVSIPMRVMLDADASDSLAQLDSTGDLSRTSADAKQAVAISLAISTQQLIDNVAREGQGEWQRRLTHLLSERLARELGPREMNIVQRLTQGIAPDLFRQMRSGWFENNKQLANDSDSASGLRETSQALVAHRRTNNTTDEAQMPPLSALDHLGQGGWFIDDEFLTLNYVPIGHADPTLAAWIEYCYLLNSGETDTAQEGPIPPDLLSSDSILKSCIECHQPLLSNASEVHFSWQAQGRPAGVRSFTKFNHGPHLKLPAVNQCSYCHQMTSDRAAVDDRLTAVGLNTGDSTADDHNEDDHDFVGIELSQCTACHRQNSAPNDCTTCHNYHVGSEGLKWSRHPLGSSPVPK